MLTIFQYREILFQRRRWEVYFFAYNHTSKHNLSLPKRNSPFRNTQFFGSFSLEYIIFSGKLHPKYSNYIITLPVSRKGLFTNISLKHLYRLCFKISSVEAVHFLVILWLIALPVTAIDKLPLLYRNHFSVLEDHF